MRLLAWTSVFDRRVHDSAPIGHFSASGAAVIEEATRPGMDVDALIERAKAGDAHAFNRLVESYQTLAFNVARQHLSDEDALDACQDAMLKAWSAISRFQGNAAAFKSWLLRVVVNSCRDRGRYVNRRPSVPIEVERDGETYVLPPPRSRANTG